MSEQTHQNQNRNSEKKKKNLWLEAEGHIKSSELYEQIIKKEYGALKIMNSCINLSEQLEPCTSARTCNIKLNSKFTLN